MNLLAFDTATEASVVGLWIEKESGTIETDEVIERERLHAEHLLEMIQLAMDEFSVTLKDIDCLVWGRGPGMFTGLRIGAGVAQGIAFGANLPVVTVSTLEVLANASQKDHVIAALDARMGQVYWAAYERQDGKLVAVTEERVDNPEDVVPPSDGPWTGVGSGWDVYAERLSAVLGDRLAGWEPDVIPSSDTLIELGRRAFEAGKAVPPEQAIPVYVRNDVARKTAQQGKHT